MKMKTEERLQSETNEGGGNNLHHLEDKAESAAFDSDDDDDDDSSVASAQPVEVFTQAKRWEDMFSRLQIFREKNGSCLVPTHHDEDPKLGFWVAEQRQRLKPGKRNKPLSQMNLKRKARLENIGFIWTVAKYNQSTWEHRFEQLLEFVIANGHTHVPIGWEENKQLARWVSEQRRHHSAMKKSSITGQEKKIHQSSNKLTQERIDLLNKVGFIWESQRGGLKRSRSGDHVPLPKSQQGKTLPPEILRNNAKKLLRRLHRNNGSVKNIIFIGNSRGRIKSKFRNKSESNINNIQSKGNNSEINSNGNSKNKSKSKSKSNSNSKSNSAVECNVESTKKDSRSLVTSSDVTTHRTSDTSNDRTSEVGRFAAALEAATKRARAAEKAAEKAAATALLNKRKRQKVIHTDGEISPLHVGSKLYDDGEEKPRDKPRKRTCDSGDNDTHSVESEQQQLGESSFLHRLDVEMPSLSHLQRLKELQQLKELQLLQLIRQRGINYQPVSLPVYNPISPFSLPLASLSSPFAGHPYI